MKILFEVEGKKTVLYLKEYRIFRVYDSETNQQRYFDVGGNEVDTPDFMVYETESVRVPDDPTFCEPLGNGYYSFSSHPIDWDPDGPYGCFGIKDKTGRVIVDEKYRQIRCAFNRLFPVQEIDGNWGCINENGELVVPCIYLEPPFFNMYGLAYGNHTLVNMQGEEIAGTEFNCIEFYDENDRYIPIILTTAEQDEQISKMGTAEGVKEAIFDTMLCNYVIKGLPDGAVHVEFYDGEPEPIIAASKMLDLYDTLRIVGNGYIVGKKGNHQDVYAGWEN